MNKIDRQRTEALCDEADVLLEKKEYRAVIELLKDADRSSKRVIYRLGDAHFELEEYDMALSYLQKWRQKNDNTPAIQEAIAYERLGDYEHASVAYDFLLWNHREEVDAYWWRKSGEMHYRLGHYEKAKEYLVKGLEIAWKFQEGGGEGKGIIECLWHLEKDLGRHPAASWHACILANDCNSQEAHAYLKEQGITRIDDVKYYNNRTNETIHLDWSGLMEAEAKSCSGGCSNEKNV